MKSTTVQDPVCGMDIDPKKAAEVIDDHYFCSPSCARKFRERHPGLAPAPERGQWTCPMHPEIVRDGPGSCPICGMALEPKAITAIEEKNTGIERQSRGGVRWGGLAC